MPELQDAVKFTPAFWQNIGSQSVKKTREHIFIQGKDVIGKKFTSYSTTGGEKSYINRKLAGKLPRTATNLVSKKVNLINTSDFMRDLQIIGSPTQKRVIIGWPAEGGKVRAANDTGRPVSTSSNPLPPTVLKWISSQVKTKITSVFKKRKNKKYRIGKK